MNRNYCCLVALMILAHLWILVWRIGSESYARDEVGHLAAGVSHIEFGSFDLYRVNPPLVRTIAAIGPYLHGYNEDWADYSDDPLERREFRVGLAFVKANRHNAVRLLVLARLATLWASLLGAYVCLRWSDELFGKEASLIALCLWCFSPLICTNGALITPDCAAASTGLLSAYSFWLWQKSPSRKTTLYCGIFLGLALLVKSTWIIQFALFPAIFGYRQVASPASLKVFYCSCLKLAVILLSGLLILNLGYGFEGSGKPLSTYKFLSESLQGTNRNQDGISGNRFTDSILRNVPIPFPENFVVGVDRQRCDFEKCRDSYVFGEWETTGSVWYYIVGLSLKEPLSTLILFSMANYLFLRKNGIKSFSKVVPELLFPALAILVLTSSQTGMNHHLRYALPAMPFFYVWISQLGACFHGDRLTKFFVLTLLCYGVVSNAAVLPHSTTFFNVLVGGPSHGHKYFDKSNLDWGQAVLHLVSWQRENDRKLFLADKMSMLNPEIYGLEFERIDPQTLPQYPENLPRGHYAVSVSCLIERENRYQVFASLEPIETIANVYLIYRLDD